jgi:hypothetical protein
MKRVLIGMTDNTQLESIALRTQAQGELLQTGEPLIGRPPMIETAHVRQPQRPVATDFRRGRNSAAEVIRIISIGDRVKLATPPPGTIGQESRLRLGYANDGVGTFENLLFQLSMGGAPRG